MRQLLDIGGGDRSLPIPSYFEGWRRVRLDIDPKHEPEVLLDARQLSVLAPATYDAVYCSHNLEHYHRHDGAKVLVGIRHVLKPDGFLELRVPDLAAVMRSGLDVDDVLYVAGEAEIRVRDVIYGWHVPIEQTGNDFYSHKTGFGFHSLVRFVSPLGFPHHAQGPARPYELRVWFFPQVPPPELQAVLKTATPQ